MSMIINFFAIPDTLIQGVKNDKTSIVEVAKYVQDTYHMDEGEPFSEQHSGFYPPLELYYYPTFSIIEKIWEVAFSLKGSLSVVGIQTFSDEEAEILLNEYVTYSAGFLAYEDINYILSKLLNLSFDDFWDEAFSESSPKKQEINRFIKKDLGLSEDDITDELQSVREHYNDFLAYLKKLALSNTREKLGLFISID